MHTEDQFEHAATNTGVPESDKQPAINVSKKVMASIVLLEQIQSCIQQDLPKQVQDTNPLTNMEPIIQDAKVGIRSPKKLPSL